MNTENNSPKENSKPETTTNSLKAVAIEIFKKSQRLPPLSLLKKRKAEKNESRPKRRTGILPLPPNAFEFGDFYHL